MGSAISVAACCLLGNAEQSQKLQSTLVFKLRFSFVLWKSDTMKETLTPIPNKNMRYVGIQPLTHACKPPRRPLLLTARPDCVIVFLPTFLK